MKPVIQLKDFVSEMDTLSDEYSVYLNIRTGEFVGLSSEDLGLAEDAEPLDDYPDWQKEVIKEVEKVLSSSDYKELPSKFEIHKYAIMKRFCYSVEDEDLSFRLLNSIRGRGAFRRFKAEIHTYGIADDWYAYRKRAFKEIAVDWLESYDIPYIDDEIEAANDD